MADLDILINNSENIQPQRGGRNVATLVAEMGKSDQSKQEEAGKYEREIADGSDIDPWLRYIQWTKEAYPGGREVQSVMERCARHFRSDSRYKDDIRYIRVWIDYISHCKDGVNDLYKLLETQGIGQNHALFYESYALYKENSSKYPDAQALYQRGIDRNVECVLRLKQHFKQFTFRMKERITRVTEETSEQPRVTDENGERKGPQKERFIGTDAFCGVTNPTKGPFSVFSGVDSASAPPVSFDIGRERDRTKENRQITTTWQRGLGQGETSKTSASFAVFSDAAGATDTTSVTESRRQGEVPAYDESLVIQSGTEFQFEEMRAKRQPIVEEPTLYGIPSPTIKTKLALEDVLSMFSGNIEFGE